MFPTKLLDAVFSSVISVHASDTHSVMHVFKQTNTLIIKVFLTELKDNPLGCVWKLGRTVLALYIYSYTMFI